MIHAGTRNNDPMEAVSALAKRVTADRLSTLDEESYGAVVGRWRAGVCGGGRQHQD